MFVVCLFIVTCGLDYIGDNHDGGADYDDGGADYKGDSGVCFFTCK